MRLRDYFKLSSFLPMLVVVCLISFCIRGMEVISGVKDLSGSAHAVENEATADTEDAPAEVETAATSENAEAATDTADASDDTTLEAAAEGEDEISDDMIENLEVYNLPPSSVQRELAEDLVKQRKRLEKWENRLMQQEALLEAAEQELDRKYSELVSLRGELEALLEEQSEEEVASITKLVKVYEGMKAKDAAAIFNSLDLDILVNVMSRMSERKTAPILAAMSPERARTVTIMLAEERQLPVLPPQ